MQIDHVADLHHDWFVERVFVGPERRLDFEFNLFVSPQTAPVFDRS